jgi:hypothetical protein
MSLPAVLARIAALEQAFQPPAPPPRTVSASPQATTGAFAGQLQTALGAPAAGSVLPVGAGGTGAGAAVVNLVRGELGVTEEPPGSNESARIARYRQATAGAPGPGPWCAYFVSWAAREAGVPLGDSGQGFGRVDDVYAWAQQAGKAIPNGPGTRPQPGDLIVWDEHIGVVESVGADGSVTTIEGNSSHMVARRQHGPGGDGAIGYVRLG